MSNFSVKIIDLEPMTFAKARIQSSTPELDAWKLIQRFIQENNIGEGSEEPSIFGIQTLKPKGKVETHEYEFWLKIDKNKDYSQIDGIILQDFPGGKYAVTRSNLQDDLEDGFLLSWGKLKKWATENNHIISDGPHFEKPLGADVYSVDVSLDLYLKIQ